MGSRLQEKIDAIKKTLRDENDFHPLLCFDEHPPQFEVELSDDYKSGMETLLQFIKHRDFLAKELANFSFEDITEARQTLKTLNKKIEKLETILGKEYDELVKDQRHKQELHEATWLQDQISREHFIMVKHLKPHIFEEFKKFVFNSMSDEEIIEELKIIKRLEKTKLEAILAADICEPEFVNPHIRRQSPYDLYNRYTLYLTDEAYETDDYFKQAYETIKNGEEAKRRFAMEISRVLPTARLRFDKEARSLEAKLRKLCRHLCDYSREKVRIGKFQERSDADEKKIADHIRYLELWRIDIFVYTKHKKPHLLEDLKKLAFRNKTEKEIEEFYEKAKECEEKGLEIIIRAVENEIH
ncbi:MAG TPA: hypothetical protein PKY59_03875 [Pyrinomonadaceae bacterium]|nr:hypothetical protein [Pyrinomonadaceae bacterium]